MKGSFNMSNPRMIVLVVIAMIAVVIGVQTGKTVWEKWHPEVVSADLVQLDQGDDADTINPRLPDSEMFLEDNSAEQDSDTVNRHVPGADIGDQIMAVNARALKNW